MSHGLIPGSRHWVPQVVYRKDSLGTGKDVGKTSKQQQRGHPGQGMDIQHSSHKP